jgi:hypothetical protein
VGHGCLGATCRWDIRPLLLAKAHMVPWRLREKDLFMRGDANVGYRKTLMPFLHEVQARPERNWAACGCTAGAGASALGGGRCW